MSGPAPSGRTTAGRGWTSLLSVVAVYTIVILVVVASRAESSTDFRDFWENALHFRQTGAISTELGVHNYLPFFTILMLPWSFLPLRVAIVIFTLLALGLFVLTVLMAETLLGGGLGSAPRRAMLGALILVLPYVHSCAVLGNVGLIVLFLIMAAWFLAERGRECEAGAALGLATLIKLMPAVLIVFFLLRRRWRVAGAAVAVTVVLGLGLPLLALGPKETIAQHRQFYKVAVRGGSALATLTSDQPPKKIYNNNAVPMVLRRLLSPLNAGKDDSRGPLFVNFVDLPRRAMVTIYIALLGVFVAGSIAVTLLCPGMHTPHTSHDLSRMRTEFGVWCCLMLLASPLVWTHYLPLAYWPLALLMDDVERGRHATGRLPRVSAAALAIWLFGAVLLAWPAARAAGAQIASVVGLWLGLIVSIILHRGRGARPA